jgi:Zn-dependent alcohol dehydrogenase
MREICPPLGVDYAVDCTGVPAVIRTMIDSLGTRGRGATVGAPGFGKCVNVDVMEHLTYGKEYVGCVEGDSLPEKVRYFGLLMVVKRADLNSSSPT